jgi:hypothetical protein
LALTKGKTTQVDQQRRFTLYLIIHWTTNTILYFSYLRGDLFRGHCLQKVVCKLILGHPYYDKDYVEALYTNQTAQTKTLFPEDKSQRRHWIIHNRLDW